MHRGVLELVRWVEETARSLGLPLAGPATTAELLQVEHQIAAPLPADLRIVLGRFNGARLPSGTLLSAGRGEGETIEGVMRSLAQRFHASVLDPELLLPFHRSEEGGLLAFDRSAGPVSDTWPVVDYYEDTGEVRLVYRTFDGWCRACVADWTSPDYNEPFSLEKYLRQGERHVAIEPDVATSHATVAHALKRAGRPEDALEAYLRAARCVPSLPWCDWEALKVAALLGLQDKAFEAASRLASRAPAARWAARETTPGRIADVIARLAARAEDKSRWVRLLDQLVPQAGDVEDKAQTAAVRRSVVSGTPPPVTRATRPSVVAPINDPDKWLAELTAAYFAGTLRDEDLLLDPTLEPIRRQRDLGVLLRIRREF